MNPLELFQPSCCTLPALHLFMLSWIHSSPVIQLESSFHILAPPPLPPQAPQGSTVGCGDSSGSPLPPAAAACTGCLLNPAAHRDEQPSSIRRKEGLLQATRGRRKVSQETCCILAWTCRHVFFEFLIGNIVERHAPGVHRLLLGCPAAQAEK